MDFANTLRRAARGMREEAGLHLVSVSSLTVAFLCLGFALLFLSNLDAAARTWRRAGHVTIFLREGARAEDIEQLTLALEGVSGVDSVEHVTAAQARASFAAEAMLGSSMEGIPLEAFPASIELTLRGRDTGGTVAEAIGQRVARFAVVEDVETYQGWFAQLEGLLSAGRGFAFGLAILVLFCVAFVVANTIRLAVAGRRDEIEVLKLCGASDRFVRGPFVVEGAVQGFAGALVAVLLLMVTFVLLRERIDATIASVAGVRAVFLPPAAALAILLAGTGVGAMGSLVSLRRYLAV